MDYLAGIALSRFQIVPFDFYELTPREFQHALNDFDEMETAKLKTVVETNQRAIWESARWVSFRAQNLMALKGRPKKVNRPDQLVKFPWEKVKKQTVDQMRMILFALAGKTPPEHESRNTDSQD